MRLSALGALLLLLVLAGCKDKQPKIPAFNPNYSEYISSFTSGVISKKSNIQIHFATSLADSAELAAVLQDEDLLEFDPEIEGQLVRAGQHSLEFIPDEDLEPGKIYRGRLALDKLLEVPDSLGMFTFGFQVLRANYQWGNVQLLATPENQMKWYKVRGTLSAADQEDLEDVQKIFTAEVEGQDLKVKWQTGDRPQEYVFEIDSVERKEQERTLLLKVDKDLPGTEKLKDYEMTISSLNDFKYLNHTVVQYPSQHIRLNFSDPIKPGQDLSGLITINNTDELRMEIENTSILVYPSKNLYGSRKLQIFPGIQNIRGLKLKETKDFTLQFRNEKPQVQVIGDGNIIPLNEKLMLPFKAISLSAVDVKVVKIPEQNVMQFLQTNNYDGNNELYRVGEVVARKKMDLEAATTLKDWNNYSLDLSELIKPEPGSMYRVYLSYEKDYSLYECPEEPEAEEEEGDYWYYDDYYYDRSDRSAYDREDYYFRYPRGYRWNERDNPCHVSYYRDENFETRNVLATNLGLIVKRTEDDHLDFTVNHLTDNQPVSGAEISIYTYQGRKIKSLKTDENGWAQTKVQDRPYFAVAAANGHKTFLKLQDGLSLSVSEFDVAGQKVEKGIKGFIYGERGVWRPGDTIFLSFILEDQGNPLPKQHPIHFELVDSRGMVVDKQVRSKGENRIYAFTTRTDGSAPTGNYTARIRVGDRVFTERVKVETVKPNRLDIDLELEKEVLDASQGQPEAKLKVEWLTGVPAANSEVKINAFISKAGSAFPDWPTYEFMDPARSFETTEKQVFEGNVGADGKANIQLQMDAINEAPGMLQGRFIVKAFEGGGEFSTEAFSAKIAPYERFVGIDMPEPSSGYYLKGDTDYDLKIKTLDAQGEPVDAQNLEVKVYKVDWHWWYNRQQQNLARYLNNEVTYLLSEGKVNTTNGSGTYRLRVDYPDWGRILVRVCDPESGHCSGAFSYIRWPSGREGRPQMGGATVLSFFTHKEKYEIGEEITARIPADEGSRVLVAVENGSGVLSKHWVDPVDGYADFKIEATPEMAPNVYLSAFLLQPHAQTKNDRPMRLYGVVPVEVYDPATKLKPVIESKDVWRPETEVTVKVKEQEGRVMNYTLAVVDEGLLNITGFNTPEPWKHFYAKEALGVKSWDMYNDVLGAFGGRLEKVFSIGGDEALAKKENSNLNRFKPVVRYFGPFKLKAGETASHSFTLPNYIGSAKIMVVAADDERAYGHADKVVKVRKPLMVLNTLPRMLSPGDEVQLPVTVFAMEDHVRDVKVSVKVKGEVQLVGESSKLVSFSKNGEKVVNFKLKVPEDRGAATVRVEATSGKESAYDETELKVRIPNPPQTRVLGFTLKPGRDTTIQYEPLGVTGTNSFAVEASTIPPLNLEDRMGYLLRYPHGCTEQTVSSVFPSLYLADLMELSEQRKRLRDRNVRVAIEKIYRRQMGNGGIRYWPTYSSYNSYVTSYAGHFLVEAEAQGYEIPAGMLSRWKTFQKQRARDWEPEYYNSRVQNHLDQAYRLYTLAVANEPEIGAMNRFRELDSLPAVCYSYLSAAYSMAGQKQIANELIQKSLQGGYDRYWGRWYYGRDMRNRAIHLMVLSEAGKIDEALPLARDVAQKVNSSAWYSTHSLAFGLKALVGFYHGEEEDKSLRWSFRTDEEKYTYNKAYQFDVYEAQTDLDDAHAIKIANNSAVMANFVMTRTGIPIDYDIPAVSNSVALKVSYLSPGGDELDVSRLQQGEDFIAEVTVTRGGQPDAYRNMALTQLMPTGWEIINTRLLEVEETGDEESPFEYQDVRDDRVYTYFDLYQRYNSKRSATFRIRLNATYAGRFYLPPVEAYDMYNENIIARVPGQWVEVVNE